jgi:hypothetical protein
MFSFTFLSFFFFSKKVKIPYEVNIDKKRVCVSYFNEIFNGVFVCFLSLSFSLFLSFFPSFFFSLFLCERVFVHIYITSPSIVGNGGPVGGMQNTRCIGAGVLYQQGEWKNIMDDASRRNRCSSKGCCPGGQKEPAVVGVVVYNTKGRWWGGQFDGETEESERVDT